MAKGFNLTAEINLRGPANLKTVAAQIRRELGVVTGNVKLNIDAKSAKNIDVINKKLNTLNATLARARQGTLDLNNALAQLGTSLSSAGSNSVSVSGNLSKTGGAAASTAKNLNVAATAMESFGKQSALAIKRFAAFSVVTSGIYALVNAVTSGFKSFIEFDKQMVVLQQVTGSGAVALKGLEAEITNLSINLGVASEDLLTVASTLAQAGLTAEETRIALKALAKTELAPSFENLTKTTEGAIAAIRQFGLEAGELEGALGSINAVAAAFAVESGDIIAAIQRTGGVFASASRGVSEGTDALNEFIAVFTSVRQTTRESAETIATGLRTIFTRIQRADTIRQLREFGIELTDLEGKFVGPYEAIKRLSEGLRDLDPRDIRFSGIVEELGGFRQVGKVLPLIQEFKTAQKALAVAQKGQSSLTDAQAIAQKSLAFQLAQVRNQFVALIRDVGKSTAFQTLFKFVIGLSKGLITLAGAFKPILPLLGILATIKGAKALSEFAGGFFGAFKGAGGAKGVGSNIGGSISGTKEKDKSDTMSKAASAIKDNTGALQTLTTAIQSLENAINSRSGGPTFNKGGQVLAFARGGVVPGTGNRDTVPAMLQPGEFVIRKKAVETVGADNLHKINKNGSGGSIRVGSQSKNKRKKYVVGGQVWDDPVGTDFTIDRKAGPRLTDGDTFAAKVFTVKEYRLDGVDAAEKDQRYGPEATNLLQKYKDKLIDNIEKNKQGAYGRGLFKNNDIGKEIVSLGYGIPDIRYARNRFDSELQEAKKQGKGIWNSSNYNHPKRILFEAGSNQKTAKELALSRGLDTKKRLSLGGIIQKFAAGGKAIRNIGYIDYDVIANEANKDIVEKGMQSAGVTGPRLYADYLIDLAVKARKSKSLDKLRAIYGVAGSGKTTLARGQGTDVGTLRETTRFPILTPEDIERANEVLILTSSVSKDKLEGFLSEVDRVYTLSSTTSSERDRIKSQRASRDITGIGLEGRTPGVTSGVGTDTAVGEALLSNALGKKSVVLGRSDSGRLRQKKGDELVDIVKKKIGFTWGGFAPTTAGHESIMDAAAAMGFAPEDFIALVGANEGIKAGDPASYRTAVFDQDFRVLLAKAGFGARGATVLPKPRDFEVPQAFDISEQGSDRRRVLIPKKGSRAFVADKTADQMAKYKEAGYAVSNLERTGGISGTMVRDLVMAGDMAKLQEVLSPGVYELISANIGRLRNRANILPSIIDQVQANQGSSLEALDKEIAAIGIKRIDSKKVASDPEYAAKAQLLEELRAKKKKIQSAGSFEPYRLLAELARSQPEMYGLDTTVTSGAPSLSGMTGVQKLQTAQTKNLGGLIRQFEDAGAVSETGGKPISRAEILKVLGVDAAAKAAGISSTAVYSLLGLRRTPNDKEKILREAIEKEYVKKVNRQAGAAQATTTRLTNRGLVFGAAGLLGTPSPPTNIDIDSDRLSRSAKVRVVSGVMRSDVAEKIDAMFTSGTNELAQKAADEIRSGYGQSGPATGSILPNINTEASIQGGLLEKVVQMLGGPGAIKGQGFDFPNGLQGAAQYFGLDPDLPTDLKRTLEGPSTIKENIVTYLKNVMGYNQGGFVKSALAQSKKTIRFGKGPDAPTITSVDPRASQLFSQKAATDSIEQELSKLGISSLQFIGSGKDSLAYDAGDRIVKFSPGGLKKYSSNLPEQLKPSFAKLIEGYGVEVMPKVDTNVTDEDLETLKKTITSKGYEWGDAAKDNMGKLGNQLVVIDGDVVPLRMPSPDLPKQMAGGGPVKLYHGTMTGPDDSVLKSIKEKGILSSLAGGYGQGSGFYVWTSRDSALKHTQGIEEGTIPTNAAKGGYKMIVELTEMLDPANWDLDYEIQAGDVANFVFENFEKMQALLEKTKGVDLGGGLQDFTLRSKNADFIHPAAGKSVRQISMGFKEDGREKRASVDTLGMDYTMRTGQIVSGLVTALKAGDPAVMDAFETEFFSNLKPGQALKYVGSAPLKPSNIEVLSTQPSDDKSWTNDPSEDIRLKKGGPDTRNYGQISLNEDTGMISAGYYKNDQRSGYLNAYKMRNYLYYVGDVRATGGFGPRLYDVAMEAVTQKGAMLTSDRSSVSDDAKGVWSRYFDSRPDVKKTPLKPDDWTATKLLDPKLYGKEETWPPSNDPAWILQSGYSKQPQLIKDPNSVTVQQKALGGLIHKFAKGGSPEDTVPALLTPGEFVINKKAAKKIGYGKLEKLNKADKIQGYNKGGYVGMQRLATGGGVFSADERELVASRAKAKGITFNAEVAEMRKAILGAAKEITNIRPKQDALRALAIENKERLKNIRAKAAAEKRNIRDELKSGSIDNKAEADKRLAKVNKDVKLDTRGISRAFEEQMKAIDPRLGSEELKRLSGELMSGLAAGMNLDDIINRSTELTAVFRGTISASEAQRIVTERLAEETGVAVTSLEQLAPAADIARQQLATEQEATFGQLGRLFPDLTAAFEQSSAGGAFTEFAQGLSTENVTSVLDSALSSRLGPAIGSGIAEKLGGLIGGLGGPLSALGAGIALLGNTIPTIGEGIDSLVGTNLSDSPAFAGLAGGVVGAGQYGASGAALGAQVGGAPGALVGAITGAIYGAVKGSITASLTKELENALGSLTESTAKADKALQAFEKDNTYANMGKVESASGEQLAAANSLDKFANANRGIDRYIPIFTKFWISSAQQAEALSAQQQALVKVLEANTSTAKGRIQRMSDADLTKASEAVKGTNAEFVRSSAIIDSYTRSIIKQRNGNIAANQSVDDYIKSLDAAGQARVRSIQQEGALEAAKAAFIAERRQMGDSEADAQKKWLDGGQKVIDEGMKLVREREEEILSAERLARAARAATVAQEKLLDIYRRMGSSLERLVKELDKMVAGADAYAAAASGEGKVGAMDTTTLDILENISAYSMDEVRGAGSNVSQLLGGTPEARKLGDTAVAAKVIQDQLPALLAETGGKDVGTLIGTLETQLKGVIGDTPESKTVIDEALKEVRNKLEAQGDEKSFEELSKDANFLKTVSDTVQAGLEAQAKVAKTYIESMNKVIDVTNKMNEALTKADEYFMKAGQIRIDSELELRKTLGQGVSLKDMNKGFETEIRSLTRNITPGGTLDVEKIYNFAARTSEQVAAPMQGITGATTDAQVNAMKVESESRRRVTKANNDAIAALKRLAEDGSRAANALSLIKENQQLAANSSDFLQKALTSNAEELADMTVDVQAYTMAVSGTAAPSQFQNLEFRQQMFRGFNTVSSMLPEELRGQIGAGLSLRTLEATNPALLDQVAYRGKDKEGQLTTVTYRQALEEQASGKPNAQTQAIINEYDAAVQTQIDANNRLAALQLGVAVRLDETRNDLLKEISDKLDGLVDRTKEQVRQDAAAAAAAAPKAGPDMTPEKVNGAPRAPDAARAKADGNWELSPTAAAGITGAGLLGGTRTGRSLVAAAGRPLANAAQRLPGASSVIRGYQAAMGRGFAGMGGPMGEAAVRSATSDIGGRIGYASGRTRQMAGRLVQRGGQYLSRIPGASQLTSAATGAVGRFRAGMDVARAGVDSTRGLSRFGQAGYYTQRGTQGVMTQGRALRIQAQRALLRVPGAQTVGEFVSTQGRALRIQAQRATLRAAPAVQVARQGLRTGAGYVAQGVRTGAGYVAQGARAVTPFVQAGAQTVRTGAGYVAQGVRTGAGYVAQGARAATPFVQAGAQTVRTGAGYVAQGARSVGGAIARPLAPAARTLASTGTGALGVRGGFIGTAALLGTDAIVGSLGGPEAVFGQEGTASRESYDTGRNLAGAGLVLGTGGAGVAVNTALDAFVTAGELIYDPAKKLNELYSDTTAIDTLNQKMEAFGPVTGAIIGSLDNAATGLTRPIDTIGKGIAQSGGLVVDSFGALVSSIKTKQAELKATESRSTANQETLGDTGAATVGKLSLAEQNRAQDQARLTFQVQKLKEIRDRGGSISDVGEAGLSPEALAGSDINTLLQSKEQELAGLENYFAKLRENEKDWTFDLSSNMNSAEFKAAVQVYLSKIAAQAAQAAQEATVATEISATTAMTPPTTGTEQQLSGGMITNVGGAAGQPNQILGLAQGIINIQNAIININNAAIGEGNGLMDLTPSTILDAQGLPVSSVDVFGGMGAGLPMNYDIFGTGLPGVDGFPGMPNFIDELSPIGPNGEILSYRETLNGLPGSQPPRPTTPQQPVVAPVYAGTDYGAELQGMIRETTSTGQTVTRGYDLRDKTPPPEVKPTVTPPPASLPIPGGTGLPADQVASLGQSMIDMLPIDQLRQLATILDPTLTGSAANYLTPEDIAQIIDQTSPDQLNAVAPGLLATMQQLQQSIPTPSTQQDKTLPFETDPRKAADARYIEKKKEVDKKLQDAIMKTQTTGEATTTGVDLREPQDCCDRLAGLLEQILAVLQQSASMIASGASMTGGAAAPTLMDTLSNAYNNVSNMASNGMDYLSNTISGAFNSLFGVTQPVEGIETPAQAFMNSISESLSGVMNAPANLFNSLFGYQAPTGGVPGAAPDVGLETPAQAFTNSITSSLSSVGSTISSFFSNIFGQNTSLGPAGLASGVPAVVGAAPAIATSALGAAGIDPSSILRLIEIFNSISNGMGNMNVPNAGLGMMNSLPTSPSGVAGSIPTIVDSLSSGLKSVFATFITDFQNSIASPAGAVPATATQGPTNLLTMDEKTAQFLDSFKASLDGFGKYVGELSTAAAQLPDKIEFNGNYNFNVNITGAEAFENMKIDLKKEFSDQINTEISRIWGQTGGGVGSLPNRSTTNKKP